MREPRKFASPAPPPPPPLPAPHSACRPGLINLIHLELIVFTFVSPSPPTSPPPPSRPPFPSGRGLGPGRGPWSGSGWRGAERLRFEPRQRHLSSTVSGTTESSLKAEINAMQGIKQQCTTHADAGDVRGVCW
ncbi:actin cytoskeleton-regulatory complex protein PAN1-like [Neopelma chrysocephalum]|uniref:actin cytoskeleton-regulatory complex protein PAN1-like n=1 Tax=Neopelma chrysocephalum TaxID=114329 RepID=UPI000FCD41B4|nr:actin cytoskeleton-regulatory complex protein PAN1-like [Neopelma chrysocephalum]